MSKREIFYPISGFEDEYLISSLGRVYSKKRNIILKASKNNRGVGVINLFKNGKVYSTNVNKLIRENIYQEPIYNTSKYEYIINISSDEKHTLEF